MLISKFNKELDLVKKQLNEIEVTITDPIERIAQKKLLERKIKKLEQSKSQIEALEQEQQELELLKSEFLINDNESINNQELEIIGSVKNCSNITNDQNNLNEPIEDAQDSEPYLSHLKELSFPIYSSNSLNKSNTSWFNIKYFAIVGIIFTSVIATLLIINFNSIQKEEQARLQELAKQQIIIAKQEVEKARQEQAKAEREKQKAQEEAKKARQEAIQAKKKADDLIKNNLYKEATTRTSPTEFIKEYYLGINNRHYNLTWQYFIPKRRANPQSFSSYTAWWNSVQNTEIKQIKILKENNNQAIVYVELNYFMKTGITYKERKSKIYLTWDSKSNNWLIEDYQQL